jgi:opacity protein-like surface antigen
MTAVVPEAFSNSAGTVRTKARVRGLLVLAALILCCGALAFAQPSTPAAPSPSSSPPQETPENPRTQYPAYLANSYVAVNFGYIQYDFSSRQLEPGFQAKAIDVGHVAGRVVLVGHEFNRFLSAQVTYLKPITYVSYKNVNGDAEGHNLFVHFGGATVVPRFPIGARVSLYGEVGVGLTSRRSLQSDEGLAIRDTQYASMIGGGGLEYHVNQAWDLTAGLTYYPGKSEVLQPHTLFWSGGFRYTMRPLQQGRVEANRAAGFFFPVNLVQVEYTTGVGYSVNDFVSKRVPIFWGGSVKVAQGVAGHYDRNVFHTRKLFALDLGASASFWNSRADREHFFTLSAYPLMRFTVVRTQPADVYLCYSLAGPTYISQVMIDNRDTGHHFTFQDFIGVGAFLGAPRHFGVSLKINHYSNGNIFTRNAGVKVPLTIGLSYAF